MQLPQYMTRAASGHYRFRFVVPQELRDALGCREIKRALGTDETEALKRYAEVSKEAKRLVREAKARMPTGDRNSVLRRMRQAGFTASDIAIVAAGRVEPETDLCEGLGIFQDELIEEYERAEEKSSSRPYHSTQSGRLVARSCPRRLTP